MMSRYTNFILTVIAILLFVLLLAKKDAQGRYQYFGGETQATTSLVFDTQTAKKIVFFPLLEKFIETDYLNSKVIERPMKHTSLKK